MKRSIKIGQRVIPLWLVITLLLSGIFGGVLANYIWTTIIIPLEVKEPLEILSYPSELSLYPGDTEEFNVTVMNNHSRNYSVILDFSLDNATYQDSYVTFSNETYTVIIGEQNLTAWLQVEAYAPPIDASLTIDFRRISAEEGVGEVLFFDDFDDGVADSWTVQLGNFEVIDGEYYTENDLGEKSIITVDSLNPTDCTIQVDLRFKETEVGFRAGIVFRYINNENHYSLQLSVEDQIADICIFIAPEYPWYGTGLDWVSVEIDPNLDYTLKVRIEGDTFTGFLNGEEILSARDGNFTSGSIGLKGQRADVFFDNFTVYSLP